MQSVIELGHVFPSDAPDRAKLLRRIEKNVRLNAESILDEEYYRYAGFENSRCPVRLRVTVELVEG